MRPAELAQLTLRLERLPGVVERIPDVQEGEEVGPRVAEAPVCRGGGLTLFERPFPRILNAQAAGDDQHLVETMLRACLEDHPAHARVHRQPGQLTAQVGQGAFLVQCAQLLQERVGSADGGGGGRFHEGERLDLAQGEGLHPQDDVGQVAALDLRLGERTAGGEFLLAVEPDAYPAREPATPSLALVGAALGDGLDGQPPAAGPGVITADPRQAAVHHVTDPRHGERGLGHVGGHHHATARAGGEDPLLLRRAESAEERDDFEPVAMAAFDQVAGFADVAFAGHEDEDVPVVAGGGQLVHRRGGRFGVGEFAPFLGLVVQGAVTHFNRVEPSRDLDDRRVIQGLGEEPGVDRGRGDDELEIVPLGQEQFQAAQQEIDVQRALVGLVEDDGLVFAQQRVALQLGQEHAVGHHLDGGLGPGAGVEADFATDLVAPGAVEFLGQTPGDRERGHPARLGAADPGPCAQAGFEAHLGNLGGLAGAGLAGDHHRRMRPQRRHDLVLPRGDGQFLRVADLPGQGGAPGAQFHRTARLGLPPLHRRRGATSPPGGRQRPRQPRPNPELIRQETPRQEAFQFIDRSVVAHAAVFAGKRRGRKRFAAHAGSGGPAGACTRRSPPAGSWRPGPCGRTSPP